jgi:predicted lysophospholipase L1 biosynthesis ABC-type transport system permease subunit
VTVQFIQSYLIGVVGAVVGAVVGLVLATVARRSLGTWDAVVTIPLLLAAAGGHLFLIPVEVQPLQVLFGLYAAALIVVVIVGIAGISIWRLGAVLFPAGSIAAYFYFAVQVQQVDYVGLGLKVVELAAIVSALVPVVILNRSARGRRMAA